MFDRKNHSFGKAFKFEAFCYKETDWFGNMSWLQQEKFTSVSI